MTIPSGRRMRVPVAILAFTGGLLAVAMVSSRFRGARPEITAIDDSEAQPLEGRPAAPAEVGAPGAAQRVGDGASRPSAATAGEPVHDGPAIHGVVVDAMTGKPIAGATIDVGPPRAEVGAPAPPEPDASRRRDRPEVADRQQWTSSPTGRFVIPWSASSTADVHVAATGHLGATRSSATVDDDLTIALRPGVAIHGRVRRRDGLGIEGATVRAFTTPKSPKDAVRGETVGSTANSGGDGGFEVLGLPDLAARVVVDHPEYMPGSALATPGGPPVEVAMVAALRAWFRVRAADGGSLAAPIVQWTRTSAAGRPLQVGVDDLSVSTDASTWGARPSPRDTWGPVRVPSEPADGTVRFVVTAPGRLPWTSDEIPVPPGGAERTIDVALERDPEAGSLSIRVVDPEGRELSLPSVDAIVSVRRTDGPSRASRPLALGGALAFEGLSAGSYDVFATHRRFGAATLDVGVEGGRETRAELRLTAAASLRVKIDAGGRRRVQFQLIRDGHPVPAFEDPAIEATAPAAPDEARLHFLAGPGGTTLRGLAAGRYAVRVVSPDLRAGDTEVEVPPGGEAAIDVHVQPR